jgi:hypothetical protein
VRASGRFALRPRLTLRRRTVRLRAVVRGVGSSRAVALRVQR